MSRLTSGALVMALVVSASGCIVGEEHPSRTCSTNADCPASQRCDRGFCIAGDAIDAGMMDGGMVDAARVDGGPCGAAGMSCNVPGMLGVCRDGLLACSPLGELRCLRAVEPSVEVCDNDDNDCNGMIDENSDVECYTGAAGCTETDGVWTCDGICQTGIRRCAAGALLACEGSVVPAAGPDDCTEMGVDPVDDDCDGDVDEDCTCADGTTQSCYAGPPGTAGVGRCMRGTQTCAGSTWGPCVGEVRPRAEACDNPGVDDDCDGTPDDVPGLDTACMPMGASGACADGRRVCQSGALTCVGPMPTTETCDGIDNDCDGSTDEIFMLSTDPLNCGACGRACGMGQSCCAGECVNVATDPASCGTCGRMCAATETCCSGTCRAPDHPSCITCDPTCSGGTTCCAGSCANTLSDRMNCGGCGITCSASQFCCGGSCVDEGTAACGGCSPCDAGDYCCDGSCEDPGPAHCGGCGVTCAASDTCCGGTTCVNTSFSREHCGTCGRACTGSDVCAMGACCDPSNVCGGRCVDRQTDSNNCGTCGRACGVLFRCSAGSCVLI